jgi:succinate-semialdehyde dehydrogenase/glutarate-semialdehyde dehydrogenase
LPKNEEKMLKSINPFNNELISEYEIDSPEIIEKKLTEVNKSYKNWKKSSFDARRTLLLKIADSLISKKEELATVITLEMGKPIKESLAEIEKCAWVSRYYAENAERQLSKKEIKTEAYKNYIVFQPIGTILAIMPWNFPFWQVFRFLAPALMAGNTAMLKHASNVQGSAKMIIDIVNQNSENGKLIENLSIPGSMVKNIISDRRISAITLTGSKTAGISVAENAGKNMKKTVFELGGSDAFIVLPDADIDKSVSDGILGRFLNSGQSCIAAKRFILHENIADEYIEKLSKAVKKLEFSDPLNEKTNISVLAKNNFVEELNNQVKTAVREGGHIEIGGKIEGNFYSPTILTNLNENSIANREEFFGPVATVFTVSDEKEAVKLANNSPFGLSSAIWTKDIEKAERLALDIEAGGVFINQFSKSDPRLPFGGIKMSGYGRELSDEGIKEFVNIKTVSIEK